MNFSDWLQKQQEREDAIGELARQLATDSISPLWSNRACTYRSYLIYRNASKLMADALECAFAEWRKWSSRPSAQ